MSGPLDLFSAFGKGEDPQTVYLFGPSNPIQGENTSADPSMLQPGIFVSTQNLRYGNDELKVRWGAFALTAAPPVAGAVFRGAFYGFMDAALRMFVAYRIAGATRVYQIAGLSGTAWTFVEITDASTRLATDGFCTFAIVSDTLGQFPADILVISNGTDAPRTWGSKRSIFGTSTGVAAIHGVITIPDANLCSSQPDVSGYVDMRTATATTAGASTPAIVHTKQVDAVTAEVWYDLAITGVGFFTMTLAGAAPAYYNDGTGMVPTAGLKIDQGKQVLIVCEDSFTDPIWRYMKITINVAGTPVIIWDPTNPVFDQPYFIPLNNTQYMVAFNIESAQVVTTNPAISFKFETITAPPQATRTLHLYGIMMGGQVDATSTYSVSHLDSTSRAESGGVICAQRDAPNIGGSGSAGQNGRGAASSKVKETIPIPTGLFLEHKITYQSSPKTASVDFAMLYRKEPGESDYFFVNYMGCPRAAWFYNNLSYYPDNGKSGSRTLTRTAPTASTTSIPYGTYIAAVNRRLCSARILNAPSEVWYSADGAPFRFSQIASVTGQNTESNPVFHKMQGEDITGISVLPGQFFGVSPSLIFTSKRIYRIEGSDAFSMSRATVVSLTGCAYPRSIAEQNGHVYYVGADSQVWRYGISSSYNNQIMYGFNQEGPISLYRIDASLAGADLTNCSGAANFYGYALSTKESPDSTQNTIRRFDGIKNQWGSDYFEITGIAGLVKFDSGTDRRLLIFGDDGNIYWHERPGTLKDGGAYIPIKLQTGELSLGMWDNTIEGYACGLVTDVPSVPANELPTFTFVQTTVRTGDVSTSEISMQNLTGARLYRISVTTGDAKQGIPGVTDIAFTLLMTARCPGNMKFKAITVQIKKASNDPDVINN